MYNVTHFLKDSRNSPDKVGVVHLHMHDCHKVDRSHRAMKCFVSKRYLCLQLGQILEIEETCQMEQLVMEIEDSC